MTRRIEPLTDRIEELLIDQATDGLAVEQQQELDRLLDQDMDSLHNEFMQTAALIQLGTLASEKHDQQHMPASLREKIAVQAKTHVVEQQAPAPFSNGNGNGNGNITSIKPKQRNPQPAGVWSKAGWAIAAALAILFIVVRVDLPTGPVVLEQQIAQVDSAADVISIAWNPPEIAEYSQVSGNVVWSDELQSGYLQLSGMPANDPRESQYQLWIVDPERGEQPVDGGVFDIPAGQETVIIPINAKLAVADPSVFAITREQPGGVVVSKGPLLVVAPASS